MDAARANAARRMEATRRGGRDRAMGVGGWWRCGADGGRRGRCDAREVIGKKSYRRLVVIAREEASREAWERAR